MKNASKKLSLVLVVIMVIMSLATVNTDVFADTNVAQGKAATASSALSGYEAGKANDGDTASRWCATSASYPQWLRIDLGQNYSITSTSITLATSGASFKYKIEVSTDGSTFTTKTDKTSTNYTGTQNDSFTATARYIRITFTGSGTGDWASLSDVKVYTGSTGGGTNVAQGKSASASTVTSGYEASKANDSDTSSRWCASSASYPQWWKVDLGSNYDITGTTITLAPAGSTFKYKIEVSTDGSTFTTKTDKTSTNYTGTQNDSFTATARYIRITFTGSGTGDWASLSDVKVYTGSTGGGTNVAQGKSASASTVTSGYEASKANDSDTSSRWCASSASYPQWWKVDLGSNYDITGTTISLAPTASTFKYKIEVSTDGSAFTTKTDKTSTNYSGTQNDSFTATARYIRITLTGSGTSDWASLSNVQVFGTLSGGTPDNSFQTEIIIRTPENFQSNTDVVNFMNMAATNHVSVISLLVKEDEDETIPSGYVFYNSAIAPKASGYSSFDALASVINEAHSRGIKVKAWIPQFHDKAAIDQNANWQMMSAVNGQAVPYTGSNSEYFVSPLIPAVQAYESSIISEVVTNYDVDGIVLDWIRFDDYNMDVSSYSRSAFQSAYGYDPLTINFTTDNTQRRQWQDWRTTKLADYFAAVKSDVKAIKPNIELGVYVLPLEFVEVAQDASKFASSIDSISPMAYYDDWGFTTSWVYNNCIADAKTEVGSKTVIPTFDVDWTDAAYHDIYSNIRSMYPETKLLSFFVYGQWTNSILQKLDNMRSW